jgi:hypothetical protein
VGQRLVAGLPLGDEPFARPTKLEWSITLGRPRGTSLMSEVGGSDSLSTYRKFVSLRIDGVRWKGFPMSRLTIVNRSQLFAAATAVTAVGFLTFTPPAQAHPMLPLAPPCGRYDFPAVFTLKQSNGDTVQLHGNYQDATGPAVATGGTYGALHASEVAGGITFAEVVDGYPQLRHPLGQRCDRTIYGPSG